MFFKKNKKDESIAASKNWYEDRYQTVVVQRNFLVILILISTVGIIISTLGIIEVTSSKKIEPFVIEIEEKTGITNVIRPFLRERISQEEALKRYFLFQYVQAREGYNPSTYKDDYYKKVRLLSNQASYTSFREKLRSGEIDDIQSSIRSRGSRRDIEVLSINDRSNLNLQKGKDKNVVMTYLVNFKATTTVSRGKTLTRRYSAIIDFQFEDLENTLAELSINPLGFQVTRYAVNPDTYYETEDVLSTVPSEPAVGQ
ncbi:MAG: hypothetical protein COV35_04340 [Alphaproteobacteria bacterium CG11_big_fil_rev_8_21_14_0_20_39_49]|nr:MAG: hypothetical protein COV35_04340 [Alphaproteobacteria bacterium CG11_big_fil_rev_8_21_14_0_20_39_49]